MVTRHKNRAFDKLERADQQVAQRLKSEPVTSSAPRKQREAQHVEWTEDKVGDDVKAAVHLERQKRRQDTAEDMRQNTQQRHQIRTLARRQAEKQWEKMVNMAIGNGALVKAQSNPGVLNQNLAAYLTSGPDQPDDIKANIQEQNEEEQELGDGSDLSHTNSPHVWATAQEEVN